MVYYLQDGYAKLSLDLDMLPIIGMIWQTNIACLAYLKCKYGI